MVCRRLCMRLKVAYELDAPAQKGNLKHQFLDSVYQGAVIMKKTLKDI